MLISRFFELFTIYDCTNEIHTTCRTRHMSGFDVTGHMWCDIIVLFHSNSSYTSHQVGSSTCQALICDEQCVI